MVKKPFGEETQAANTPGDAGCVRLWPEPLFSSPKQACHLGDPGGQCSRRSWSHWAEAGAPVRQIEHAILEIQTTNAPGDPGRVVLRPEPCLPERTCRTRNPDDQHSRKSWLCRVEAGAPVHQSKHTVLEIQDGQRPRKSWLRCIKAGASIRQNERVVPEIQTTNAPGDLVALCRGRSPRSPKQTHCPGDPGQPTFQEILVVLC